jgi:type III secretion protein V
MNAMSRLRAILTTAGKRQDLVIVILIVTAIVTMILPIPTMLVDGLIALNIGMSIVLLMVAFFLGSPVEFSSLPAVILISTVFRLSISITTSRLVLANADAGAIIRTFGEFVIASNAIVGLVVFLIITIVQFVVITKGSERVAEVAARFTLDALPGKQMSIDADLRNGDINQVEARQRRRMLERESQLYGAMDGAMKFVKGDAIAGLIIIAVNLIGGIAVGTIQHRLRVGEAVQIYSLLTIGDGLISQIPALFVSMAAGTVVTRVAADGDSNLGTDIVGQVVARPEALRLAGLILVGLALVPGFPAPIFVLLGCLFGAVGFLATSARKSAEECWTNGAAFATRPATYKAGWTMPKLKLSPVMIIAERRLHDRYRQEGIADLIERARQDVADELGFACPAVGVAIATDRSDPRYRIELNNVPILEDSVDLLSSSASADAAIVRLKQVLRRHASEFLGIQETKRLLSRLDGEYSDLLRETQRAASLQRITEVLKRLLDERVSIANLRLILEVLAEWAQREQSAAALTEHLRFALRRQICHACSAPGRILHGVVLDRESEETIRAAGQQPDATRKMTSGSDLNDRLVEATKRIIAASGRVNDPCHVVLVTKDIRRHVAEVFSRTELNVSVLSYQEISNEFSVIPTGVLSIDAERAAEMEPLGAAAAEA